MKVQYVALVSGLCLTLAMAADARPPDPEAGRAIADVTCAPCHGVDGISLVAAYPNLKGQNAKYLVKQLEAFRAGERKDPLMNSIAGNLSGQDIANLAALFSELE